MMPYAEPNGLQDLSNFVQWATCSFSRLRTTVLQTDQRVGLRLTNIGMSVVKRLCAASIS